MLGQRNACMREGQDRLQSITTVIEEASLDVAHWHQQLWPSDFRFLCG